VIWFLNSCVSSSLDDDNSLILVSSSALSSASCCFSVWICSSCSVNWMISSVYASSFWKLADSELSFSVDKLFILFSSDEISSSSCDTLSDRLCLSLLTSSRSVSSVLICWWDTSRSLVTVSAAAFSDSSFPSRFLINSWFCWEFSSSCSFSVWRTAMLFCRLLICSSFKAFISAILFSSSDFSDSSCVFSVSFCKILSSNSVTLLLSSATCSPVDAESSSIFISSSDLSDSSCWIVWAFSSIFVFISSICVVNSSIFVLLLISFWLIISFASIFSSISSFNCSIVFSASCIFVLSSEFSVPRFEIFSFSKFNSEFRSSSDNVKEFICSWRLAFSESSCCFSSLISAIFEFKCSISWV